MRSSHTHRVRLIVTIVTIVIAEGDNRGNRERCTVRVQRFS
jgi:hypothetical protein